LCRSSASAPQTAANSQGAQKYFQEGEKAISENRLGDAIRAYEKLAQIDPGVPEVHAKLGLIYYIQNRFADAVPQLRTALQLNPSLPNAGTLLAICYAELGRYNEALPGLEKAFRHSPDPKLRRLTGLQLVRSYNGLGQRDKAVQTTLELCRAFPDDPEILYDMGHLFGDISYSAMKRLAAVAPDSVWVLEASGEKYETSGAYDLAITQYRKAIQLDAAHPDIHFRLGRALLAKAGSPEDRGEALNEFQAEYKLSGANTAAYEIGEIYRRAGQGEKALEYFGLAIKNRPGFEEAQIGIARVLLQLNQPSKALPHLQQALQSNPENEVAHYQLARVYAALGNTAAQKRELDQFQKLREQKQTQQTFLSRGLLGEVTQQTLDSGVQ
jgi:tetratricopeptide (TPR) repeat protein